MTKQKHLNLEARTTIEPELGRGNSFKGIALLLGKDNTTISKEIRAHTTHDCTGSYVSAFNDCINNVNPQVIKTLINIFFSLCCKHFIILLFLNHQFIMCTFFNYLPIIKQIYFICCFGCG